jgi:hypothetical protein
MSVVYGCLLGLKRRAEACIDRIMYIVCVYIVVFETVLYTVNCLYLESWRRWFVLMIEDKSKVF